MNARIKYNHSHAISPRMDMAFLDECFIDNKKMVCGLILGIAKYIPGFHALLGRDYRGEKVLVEDIDAFGRIDLSSAGFYVVDKSWCELARFGCMWWNNSPGGFNYPSVKIHGFVLAGFDGDWEGYCSRLKVFTRITTPLWASVQYYPVTKSWSQDFRLQTAHETKIPFLGLADFFGRAYIDGIFGGWEKVAASIGERGRKDRGGVWVEYADYMRCNGGDFESYRASTERSLLDCDVWGVDSSGKYPIKSKILESLEMDGSRFESPELRTIGDAVVKMGEVVRSGGKRVDMLRLRLQPKGSATEISKQNSKQT